MKLKAASKKRRRYRLGARARAAEATGNRIVDAFLARLMKQWFDQITLDSVAADAAVTVQTIVRRFGGKEGLLLQAVKTLAAQINAQRASPPNDIKHLVDHLIQDYERTGDAVIRLLALEPHHPALRAVTDFGRAEHRRWVSETFAEVLGDLDASARRRAVDTLVISTDVYTWKLLRRDMGRSADATAATIKSLVRGALTQLSNRSSRGSKGAESWQVR